MKKWNQVACSALAAMGILLPQAAQAQTAGIEIDAAQTKWKISEYLTGGHFVYGFENDTLYQDERISDFFKASKAKTIRWPGGTVVQSYHWDDLTGIPFPVENDSWGKKFNESMRRKPECYMDLDEYIAYCRKIGAEPMVGVNIRSGVKYKREADALDEARRLIQYCKDKNYNVKNWYIGNECYIMFRKENYIKYSAYIDKYAEVLRSVDPDINIIGDWQFGGRLKQIINLVRQSKHINMMEIHEKWGNGFGMASGNTFAQWKKEFPIYKGQLGRYIDQFRDSMKVMGREDVKLAMNEWGLSGKSYPDAGDFECGLMCADFLMELFKHRVDMACYWNLNAGGNYTKILRVNKDTINDGAGTRLESITPVGTPFILLGSAMGKQMLEFTTPMQEVYGFAAIDDQQSAVDVYLLNKGDGEVSLPLALKNFAGSQMTQHCFAAPGLVQEKQYEQGDFKMVLPGLSFSHFVISKGDATGVGQLEMEKYAPSEVIFDLGGKRVVHPQKGIYIINGKRVMVG